MKMLKTLVVDETLKVEELMMIKGAAAPPVSVGCENVSCERSSCTGQSCSSNSCKSNACREQSCGGQTCNSSGCNSGRDANVRHNE